MVVKGLKSFLHDNGEIYQSAKCRLHPRGEDLVSFSQLPGLASHPRAHHGRSRVATTDCLFYNMIEISWNDFHLLSVGEQDNTTLHYSPGQGLPGVWREDASPTETPTLTTCVLTITCSSCYHNMHQ